MLRSPPKGSGAGGGSRVEGAGWRVRGREGAVARKPRHDEDGGAMEKVWELEGEELSLEVCRGCRNRVGTGQMGLECEICKNWFHAKCQKINKIEYEKISEVIDKISWQCKDCGSFSYRIMEENKQLRRQVEEMKLKIDDLNREMRTIFDIRARIEETEGLVKHRIEMFAAEIEKFKDHQESIERLKGKMDDILKEKAEEIYKQVEMNGARAATEINERIEKRFNSLQEDIVEGHSAKTGLADLKQEIANVKQGIFKEGLGEVKNMQEQVERMDRETRKKNLIVFNFAESDKSCPNDRYADDEQGFLGLLLKLGIQDFAINKLIRLGRKETNKVRPLLVKSNDENLIKTILQTKKELRNSIYKKVYIVKDMSTAEREKNKRLRTELSLKRNEGNARFVIRRGQILKVENPEREKALSSSTTGNGMQNSGCSGSVQRSQERVEEVEDRDAVCESLSAGPACRVPAPRNEHPVGGK